MKMALFSGFSGRKAGFAAVLLGAGLFSLGGLAGHSAYAQSGAAASSTAETLDVAVRYVAPPFVGGSKVRTPESPETFLISDAAKRAHQVSRLLPLPDPIALEAPEADAVLATLPKEQLADYPGEVIPTGYIARPMAIMRTDTDIKRWDQLKGRTVCLSQDGLYVGRIAQHYGAVEQVYRAPADALLAVRTGECDAAVHDEAMLLELIKFPEWKKFSARLPAGEVAVQAFLVNGRDRALAMSLKNAVDAWKSERYLAELAKTMARDIAFEVYLDQTVPDCH